LPRDLADVLHYFLPELDATKDAPRARPPRVQAEAPPPKSPGLLPSRFSSRLPLSVLGVPIGERDLVHAAFTWNLAAETARLGAASVIVAPRADRDSALWPATRSDSADAGIVYTPARSLEELGLAAARLAEERSKTAARGGIVFARIPPDWLRDEAQRLDPIRWLLLFASPRRADVASAVDLMKKLLDRRPGIDVGITIHGVRRIADARAAFDDLARRCDAGSGAAPVSYGMLVDDLDLDRSIAAGRPLADTHPRTPAARALMDVARLLYEDARSRVLG